MKNDKTVRKFVSSGGVTAYKLPVEAFDNHVTNCYLVMDDPITLLDTASGRDSANQELLDCFGRIREEFGEKATLNDVDRLIITHGHIDHFGGVNFVAEESDCEIGIHELDLSVVQNFKERLLVTSTNLHFFLDRSGLSEDRVTKLLNMNKWSKDSFKPRTVDFTFEEGRVQGGQLIAHHAPGHCPGQVCLQLHDILFTADHVLSHITPNQAPEAITRYTGLGHYMESLRKIRKVEGIRIGLGGHEEDMEDVAWRIDDTLAFHEGRLKKTLALLTEPSTVAEVSLGLFGPREKYHVLLAMLETGAHMEYLYERGSLVVTNYEDVDKEFNPVLKYQAV
jgi:glyoxylase-like metal-dependent hydrolase (beta-lactamase superfamily II)